MTINSSPFSAARNGLYNVTFGIGDGSGKNILDAGLGGRGHRNCVSVTPESSGNPENVDFWDGPPEFRGRSPLPFRFLPRGTGKFNFSPAYSNLARHILTDSSEFTLDPGIAGRNLYSAERIELILELSSSPAVFLASLCPKKTSNGLLLQRRSRLVGRRLA